MSHVRITLVFGVLLVALVACGGNGSLRANAGQDFSVAVGQEPTFNGCTSTGEIANYKWTIVRAAGAQAVDTGKVIREVDPNCSFTLGEAMGVDEVGDWVIELEVRDAVGNNSTDRVTVAVGP
jgi:hypothetical protein